MTKYIIKYNEINFNKLFKFYFIKLICIIIYKLINIKKINKYYF